MTESRTIALAQQNFTVGDLEGNLQTILDAYAKACAVKTDLVVFPELAITGYPPEDLVRRRAFRKRAIEIVHKLAEQTKDKSADILVGGLWLDGENLYNAAILLTNGNVSLVQPKVSLPNYGVFDEKRLFKKGPLPSVIDWRGITLAVYVCEDMWDEAMTDHFAKQECDLQICINASPYEMGKAKRRKDMACQAVEKVGAPLLYLNMVGGQDELVFDGRSFALNRQGKKVGRLKGFESQQTQFTLEQTDTGWQLSDGRMEPTHNDLDTIYLAMVLGLRDYVNKNGFPGVVIALSGGIDSALTAAVAVDALGADRVHSVLMPSPYTSKESIEDATKCAEMLGISMDTIPITPAMKLLNETLADVFEGKESDETEENIQARLRANILMAMSNKLKLMVLTTGNKSEMSVGYATLYGDMCGGYSVLKDVYKITVYKLSSWRNICDTQGLMGPSGRVIPERIITKPPSAELKPNQTDQDTLPPYAELDAILLGLIEHEKSIDKLVKEGFARDTVEKVNKMLFRAEYKRRQAPPGVKITGMSFGRDRRYPITNKFEN